MRYALSENSGTSASRLLLSRVVVAAPSAALRGRANVRIHKAHGNESLLREEAERKAEESRQQLVRLNVSTGNRLLEEGDNFRALLWFTEALRLENGDKAREDVHRRRIASVLRQSPELAQVLFDDAAIFGAEFGPDGARVATTGFLPFVRIWDVTTGKIAAPPLRHETNIANFRFTADGRRIATIDASGRLEFWDVATGEVLSRIIVTNARAEAGGLEFSPDDKWVAVACSDGVRVFDGVTGGSENLLPSANGADFVRFNFNNRQLVAAGPREVLVWSFDAGTWTSKTLKHPARLQNARFSADGGTLVTTTTHGLFVWDVASGELVRPMIPSPADLFDCRFSADGKWLVTVNLDGVLRLFAAEETSAVTDAMRHGAGGDRSIISPDSRRLATASWDHSARVWEPAKVRNTLPWQQHGGGGAVGEF